jgi:hypothetical protein
MACAERLAIRKLLSKAIYDATLTPGPPLPRSHPSPSLLAKLQLNVTSLLTSASSLTKLNPTNKFLKDAGVELQLALRRYIDDGLLLSSAVAYKWLGVDLGEAGAQVGEAIAWLQLAQAQLNQLAGPKLQMGRKAKEGRARLAPEFESVAGFLTAYKGLNNRVRCWLEVFGRAETSGQITYQPIPASSTLLSRVPGGRSALKLKPYALPAPSLAGQSSSALESDLAALTVQEDDSDASDGDTPGASQERTYALATEYF